MAMDNMLSNELKEMLKKHKNFPFHSAQILMLSEIKWEYISVMLHILKYFRFQDLDPNDYVLCKKRLERKLLPANQSKHSSHTVRYSPTESSCTV